MLPFEQMEHHPTAERVVKILCDKIQTKEPLFFRVLVAHYFSLLASQMRCSISTLDRGDIPVNMYALNLAPSGFGKGMSTGLVENQVIHLFRQRFLDETFLILTEENLSKIAHKRASKKGVDPDEELQRVQKEFEQAGQMVFSFDSGTTPAVKQLRHKLLMANAGSVNLAIDEIGSNLLQATEVLTTFFELYDVGAVKPKLTKNTAENIRGEEIIGRTPTNMMLFGTPSKLLNGSKAEEELYSMLEAGFARRCFFSFIRAIPKKETVSAERVFDMLTNQDSNTFLEELAERLERLADIINANKKLVISKDTSIKLIQYRLHCEKLAEELPEYDEMRKAELSHRYFKVLKLAGAYAFIDDSPELTESHLYNAIKLAEESGEAFDQLLTRDPSYCKLARYIATVNRNVTQPDLVEALPFYRGSASQRAEMMQMAIAHGYQNNIIIKKSFIDGVEFLRGETLKPTDLSQIKLAWSTDMTEGYRPEAAPWDKLHQLTQTPGLHWVTHHLKDGYRNEENALPGFNLVVIDVDGTCNLSTAKLLLKGYRAMFYTTCQRRLKTDPLWPSFAEVIMTHLDHSGLRFWRMTPALRLSFSR